MFGKIAWFELRYQIRQPVFIVTALLFGLMTFLSVTVDNIQIGSNDAVHVNSPFAVMQTLAILSLFGMFIPVAMLANVVLRDGETRMAGIMHSLPVEKYPFLAGRFTGAFVAVMLAFSATALGMALGSVMWWLDPETVGPFRPGDYLFTLAVIAIPNLLATGSVFFAVATATRSLMVTYASLVAVLVIYLTLNAIFSDIEYRQIRAFLDPFGLAALGNATRYWTMAERNGSLPPLEGALLWNRLIWLGVGLGLTALTLWRFSFTERAPRKDKGERSTTAPIAALAHLPVVKPAAASLGTGWAQLRLRTRFETVAVMKSLGFIVLVALGGFNAFGALIRMGSMYGTDVYPVTRIVVELLNGTFSIVPMVVSVYYAGELVWRERQAKFHEIIDAMPVPNWVFVTSKFIAMALVLFILMLVASLIGIAVQLYRGTAPVELGLYLKYLFLAQGWQMLQFAVLSLFLQALSGNKYLGMLLATSYIIASMVAQGLGLEDNLLFYSASTPLRLSDMNGMGHFALPFFWFSLYWTFAALILLLATYRVWTRGTLGGVTQRLGQLRQGWTRVQVGILLMCLGGFIASGGYIFRNTHVLNDFETSDQGKEKQVAFEKKYRQYENLPQPRIVDVRTDIDLFPAERRAEVRGSYLLENRTPQPIDRVHVLLDPDLAAASFTLEGQASTDTDAQYGYSIVTLSQPMQPGEKRRLDFQTRIHHQGFTNDGGATDVVYNGSFLNNFAVAPIIGFSRQMLLQSRSDRRKYGLDPIDRMAPLEDEAARQNNYLRHDSDWVGFETTVSTSKEQIAVAPGYLVKEWTDGDRRYFHYKMDKPILNFYSWLSATYTVKTEQWNGIDLSVYYHAPHGRNVDRMIQAMKASLEYYNANFGPYQHRQMRILEFPDYAKFAQAFPNTVPYSEGIGFIADNSDPEKIDYVWYVTAHEVAHQWWAHQVMGADVQGATLLSETLAQYSALMVMEKQYGPDKIRRFLKYELDSYLRGRGGEDREEQPLYRVENQQYIHYRKGAVALYFLRDQLGEAVLNRALARLVQESAYHYAPYPTSLDLIRLLKEEAGPDKAELIADTLERIVIYDVKVKSADAEKLPSGKYKVTLGVEVGKVEADGSGKETPKPFHLPVDIGLFTANPADKDFDASKVVKLEKLPINQDVDKNAPIPPMILLVFEVDQLPTYAGIDPYNKLIDRNSDDNLMKVTLKP